MTSGYFLAIFFLFTYIATLDRTRRTFSGSKGDSRIYFKSSFYVLFLTYLLCVGSSVAELLIFRREPKFAVTFLGGVFFLSGMFLRNSAIRNLGKQWSVHIDLRRTEEIVRSGPYKYMRHPYYFAVLLELVGFSLMSNSFFSLMLILTIQLPLILWRVSYEERALVRRFGRVYLWYRRKLGSLPL